MEIKKIYLIGIITGLALGVIFGIIGLIEGASIGIATGGTAFAATYVCCCFGWIIGVLLGLIPIVLLLSKKRDRENKE